MSNETTSKTPVVQPCLVLPLSWPDRPGFWWVRHKWGMELAESKLWDEDDDEEGYEPEAPYSVVCHVGEPGTSGPYMPNDFDSETNPPVFLWLGESFIMRQNA